MFYFLSSTRRHTRWPRDWSSDVCSSDLKASELNNVSPAMIMPPTNVKCMQDRWKDFGNEFITANVLNAVYAHLNDGRSEERRVGKECRCRWEKEDDNKTCNNVVLVERGD